MDRRQKTPTDYTDLHAILQKMHIPLTLADGARTDSPIVAINPAFAGLVGYQTDEVVGRNCRFLQADHVNLNARYEIRAAIKEARSAQVILKNERADGSEFWNYLTVQPISDTRNPARYFLGAQFLMQEDEVQRLGSYPVQKREREVSDSLTRHRALMLERRRISIDAAARLVQSCILIKNLKN